jgi:hypothetical protein
MSPAAFADCVADALERVQELYSLAGHLGEILGPDRAEDVLEVLSLARRLEMSIGEMQLGLRAGPSGEAS